MRRKFLLVVVLILCGVAYGDEWKKEFTVGAKPELRVSASDARIEVRRGGPKIMVTVTTEGWKIGPGDVRIYDHQSGDAVVIDVQKPSRGIISFGGRYNVYVTVTLPANTKVNLRSGDGVIVLSGLQAPADLSTGDGRIEVRDFSGPLNANTDDGRMEVEGRFDALNLSTGDGRIECTVREGSKMSAPWYVRTNDGSINLRLPRDFAAELQAETGDGHITVRDLNLAMRGTGDERRVRGTLNGGSNLLNVRSGDGSIEIGY